MSVDQMIGALTEALEELVVHTKEQNKVLVQHNQLLREMLDKADASAGAKPARKTRTRKAAAKPEPEAEAEAGAEAEAKPKTARKPRAKKKAEPEVVLADALTTAAEWLGEVPKDERGPRREAIKDICKDFGVTRLSELSEDDAPKVLAAVKAAIEDAKASGGDDEDDLL